MSKKKQQLVIEVLTDKDWDENIKFREGLVLADIYSEAFGPSAGMLMRTKQYKVEHPQGELLTLAAVDADGVTLVKRLGGHSEPTFMFLVNGLMVNMYIGCNGPAFSRMLDVEFNHELDVRRGIGRRKFLPFDKPTQAEIDRDNRLYETAFAEQRAEAERREQKLRVVRENAYEQLTAPFKATTVVVYLPSSVEGDQLPELAGPLREQWAHMGIEVARESSVIINEEMANEMFYERKLPQHSALVEVLQTGYSIAMMLKKVGPAEGEEDKGAQGDTAQVEPDEEAEEPVGDTYPIDIGEIEKIVAKTIYGFYPGGDEDMEKEEEREEEEKIYSAEEPSDEEEEEEEYWGEGLPTPAKATKSIVLKDQPRDMRPPAKTPAAILIRRLSDGMKVPGIYAPFTPYSKCAAVRVLFPAVAAPYYELEEVPAEPPPSVVVIFDVAKRDEVMEIVAELGQGVTNVGFFNDKNERLVDTVKEYNGLRRSGARDKMALSVVRTTSAPLLALSVAGPIYVSPNTRTAVIDDQVFFGLENIANPHRVETPPQLDEDAMALLPPPPRPVHVAATADGEGAEGEGEDGREQEEERAAPAAASSAQRVPSNAPSGK